MSSSIKPTLEIGDVVLYHFTSFKQFGDPATEIRTRPAIITSFAEGSREVLNLHVYFEDRDFVSPRQRALQDSWGPLSRERTGVQPALYHDHPDDNVWTVKRSPEAPGRVKLPGIIPTSWKSGDGKEGG